MNHAPIEEYRRIKNDAERGYYDQVTVGVLFLPFVILVIWPAQLLGAVIAWLIRD